MICDILNNLNDNQLILTVNQRLCIELQRQFQLLQTNQGKSAWNTALIVPINTWIHSIWEQYTTLDLLPISSWQELCIWQGIVQQDPALTLLQSEQTAALAQQAWKIIQLWQLDLSELNNTGNLETQQFYQWAGQFEATCQQKKLLPQAQLTLQTMELLQNTAIQLPATIYLAGFDQYPPALLSLIQCLQQQTTVETISPHKKAQQISRYVFKDEEDEIQQIALWAKTELIKNKTTHIACIFPRLNEQRATIARIFNETLYSPLHTLQHDPAEPLAYNISAARPLTHYPIMQTAYQLLAFCRGQLNVEQISYLLQSPYVANNHHDIDLGSQIDFELRELNEINLSIHDIFAVIVKLQPAGDFKQWITRWHQLRVTLNQLPTKQPASQWANSIRQLLASVGWPGGRTLNSQEYQLCEKLNTCLREFASLDLIYEQLSLKKAIKLFLKQLTQTTFQPEGSVAPIQILGVLESSGLHFAKIWIAGLDDEQWPPAANPNPFLPIDLQRQQQTPHSSADRELEFCRISMQRLLNSAEEVFVSHYQQNNDQQKKPSQLIKHLNVATLDSLVPSCKDLLLKEYPNDTCLQTLADTRGQPISTEETIRGGSHILKQQALCPFRAFASIRLNAEPINEPCLGLKATQRGIMTHQVLENIWRELQDSATLHKTAPAALQQLIERKVTQAIQDLKLPSNKKTNQIFLATEEQRLTQIIHQWLAYEKKRSPFKVLACEEKAELTLGELPLKLRIDRLDELADGRRIIIDYKTGATKIKDWLSDNLTEPQLPLYCIDKTQHDKIEGVAFAQIQPASMRFKGILNDQDTTEPHLDFTQCSRLKATGQTDWNQLVSRWQQQLTELSHHFCQGQADRQPNNATTCQTCQLQALCRIFENE